MRLLIGLLLVFAGMAAPLAAQAPSGQPLVLWEVRWERVPDTDRVQMILRALAPDLGVVGFEVAQGDMDYLCANYGAMLGRLAHARADEIVVNLGDKPVPRGTANPEATQYFAVYSLQDGRCISEGF